MEKQGSACWDLLTASLQELVTPHSLIFGSQDTSGAYLAPESMVATSLGDCKFRTIWNLCRIFGG